MKLIHFFEKIDDMDMGDVIKDFYKSDAPQFKGKSKKKRRDMAIAAKLSADESVQEGGCLGKQIKKGKKKVKEDQSYDDLRVAKYLCYADGRKFKPYGVQTEYIKKAEDMREENPDKYQSILRQPSPPSDDSWRSKLNNSVQEDVDLNDNMVGTPDSFYDEEERKEAYLDLKDAMDELFKGPERDGVIDGICPNCAGTSYQDAEDEVYNDETGEYEEGNECDGWGNFGCDQGEMVGASWVEIIKHDERKAEKEKAKADYPGDEEVVNQIARAVKQLDDPRQIYQYMKADYPFMGIAQRSSLIAQGMKKAGLTSESITEGEERSIIADACVEKLVDEFGGRENQFQNKDDLEYAIYQALEDLDVEDCVDPEMEVGGQPIGDFASGRVIDCCSSSDIIYDVMANMDETQIGEGRIEDTFGTDTVDKHDKPKKKKKDNKEIDELKRLSGIKNEGRPFKSLDLADIVKLPNGKEYVFNPQKGMFIGTDGTYPGGQEEIDPTSRSHKELLRLRKNQANRFKGVKEDAEGDASESAVAKMIAKALGDENRWTEMSAAELYAELESENAEMADMIKDVARMIYGVRLAENTKDPESKGDCEPCKGTGYKDGDRKSSKSCPVCDGDGEDPGFGGTKAYEEITLDEDQDFTEEFGILGYSIDEENTFEAEYQGRKVKLNKPMRGDVKKFKVYVKDPKTGNVKKVNFGHGGTSAKRKTMRIRKSNPKARKSFRARHNCDNPGPKTKARYWSCRKW